MCLGYLIELEAKFSMGPGEAKHPKQEDQLY